MTKEYDNKMKALSIGWQLITDHAICEGGLDSIYFMKGYLDGSEYLLKKKIEDPDKTVTK